MRQRIPTPKHTHHRALWEKATKGRAGTRWDSVVEKVWKDIGGNQEQILTTEKFAGCKTEVKRGDRNKGKASAKKQGERGRTLIDTRGGHEKRQERNRICTAQWTDYAKTLQLRFRVGDLDLPERRRYTSSREKHRCTLVAKP